MLLSNNHGNLLSAVFDDLGRGREYEYYKELEYDLELVDEDGNLQVDWDYYKWVIVNYTEEKHDYYANCVLKKIDKEPLEDFNGFKKFMDIEQENDGLPY
jgi:hypothetical protein